MFSFSLPLGFRFRLTKLPPAIISSKWFSQRKISIFFQIIAALAVSLGPLAAGLGKGYSSPAIASLQELQFGHSGNYTFTVSDQEASCVASLSFLGKVHYSCSRPKIDYSIRRRHPDDEWVIVLVRLAQLAMICDAVNLNWHIWFVFDYELITVFPHRSVISRLWIVFVISYKRSSDLRAAALFAAQKPILFTDFLRSRTALTSKINDFAFDLSSIAHPCCWPVSLLWNNVCVCVCVYVCIHIHTQLRACFSKISFTFGFRFWLSLLALVACETETFSRKSVLWAATVFPKIDIFEERILLCHDFRTNTTDIYLSQCVSKFWDIIERAS